ncbi:hypothetical protein HOY82DRAFT_580742 [Tuber indicum]|nr:hypothetical protein HOY82DRAFT_580742 [Tuber indicum]
MSNTSSPHGTYIPVRPVVDLTSLHRSDASRRAKLSTPWNFSCPPVNPREACISLAEAVDNITPIWSMSGQSYILSRLNDELAQYRDMDCDFSPTDPRVERMLEDFEMSEIEDWRFHTMLFDDLCGNQCEGNPLDEIELYEAGLLDSVMVSLLEGEYQGRLLDEALLEDLERYEEEVEEFWMKRGVARAYGMWDEEDCQVGLCGSRQESTCHLGHEEIEANSTFQAEHSRDVTKKPVEEERATKPQIYEVLWWKQMCKHGEDGAPGVVFWQGPPRGPNQPTEPRKPTHMEVSSPMFEAMEYLEPHNNDLTSSGSECGQNSIYEELPEEDPDWIKLDEREHVTLPPPPSPIFETYIIEIPKIPEQDEAWTLIVPS